ncbi:hypothetical protein HAX54_014071 [Datura stramonium]|uniref:Chitin-binding type-1 domain-containing protein n=1 Tax=Datura stramonium TaxID=4076 RepID=A0ABS8TMG9_DATST|nr:hypothetical protein [Datura stramonium]
MRHTAISLLALALFFLKVSAKLSLPFYFPANETLGLEVGNTSTQSYSQEQERCGIQGGGRRCPTGMCCGYSGLCGNTSKHCNPNNCQSQCSGPFRNDRCGWQANGRSCPTGVCCSVDGWCGTTSAYCAPSNCQDQCEKLPPPSPSPPTPSYPQGRCGRQAGGRKCPTGVCCSFSGWCGTTSLYCDPYYCQSQCKTLTSSTQNRKRGSESFLLNIV